MATREIKTTIALDGEQKFKQALSAATREMRVMESELKAVSAAYDVNGNSAEFFAAKQKNIRDQISQQRQIIEALERAVEDAAKAYGEGSTQVDGYAIRLNNARTRMSRLEKELEATDREIEELGRDSVRAGRQLEDGIGEGAENAERSVKDLMQTMEKDISSIKTSTAFTAVSNLWDMATGAYSSVAGFVESTAEYRRQLSLLEHAAKTSGFDFEFIEGQLTEVQGITADANSAMAGLRSLLTTEMNERQFQGVVDNLLGAIIKYPEFNFDSIADDYMKSVTAGEATGQFAELLKNIGVDTEKFNQELSKSQTLAGDVDVALGKLAANGLAKVYEEYKKNNEQIINYNTNQSNLEKEAAKLGGTLSQYIITPVKQVLADVLKEVNDIVEEIEDFTGQPAIDAVKHDVNQKVEEGSMSRQDAEKNIQGITMYARGAAVIRFSEFLKSPASIVKEAFKELGESFEDTSNMVESQADNAINRLNKLVDAQVMTTNQSNYLKSRYISGANVDEELLNVITEHEAYMTDAFEAAGQEAGKGFIAGLAASLSGSEVLEQQKKVQALLEEAAAFNEAQKARYDFNQEARKEKFDFMAGVTQLETVEDAVDISDLLPTKDFEAAGEEAGVAYINGLETVLDLSLYGEGKLAESNKLLTINPVEEWEETIRNEEGNIRDAGKEAGEALEEGLESGTESFTSMAKMLGSNFGANLAAGMMSQHSYVYAASSALRAAAESAWGGGASTTSTRYTHHTAGSSNLINVALNVDGREFARVTAPYMATQLIAP